MRGRCDGLMRTLMRMLSRHSCRELHRLCAAGEVVVVVTKTTCVAGLDMLQLRPAPATTKATTTTTTTTYLISTSSSAENDDEVDDVVVEVGSRRYDNDNI